MGQAGSILKTTICGISISNPAIWKFHEYIILKYTGGVVN